MSKTISIIRRYIGNGFQQREIELSEYIVVFECNLRLYSINISDVTLCHLYTIPNITKSIAKLHNHT